MPNTYLGVYNQVRKLPVISRDTRMIIPGIKVSYFANGTKEYDIGARYVGSPFQPEPKMDLIEEYFHKIKGFTWFEEKPFFKKVSRTRKQLDTQVVDVTRTNGRGTSSKTIHDENGIRISKVQQKLVNPKKDEYQYTRLTFDERGTHPKVMSQWKDKYIPLDNLV